MTDRYNGFIVVLEENVRSDDAAPIIEAIKMLKGVQDVVPHIFDANEAIAESRIYYEVRQKVFDALIVPRKER